MIPLILGNIGLFFLFISIVLIIIHSLKNRRLSFYEISFRYLTLFPLGLTAIYAFIMHAFFPDIAAKSIGWSNSPFQFEVAVANLGFGVIAILAYKASYGFRLATVIGNACWLWGDALGHIYQMINVKNFAVGNAGSWFWMDLLLPLFLIRLLSKFNFQVYLRPI